MLLNEIEALSENDRLHYYEILAHNLTILVRDIWSDDALSDANKIEYMKLVNEMMHRVTARVWKLRLNQPDYTDDGMLRMLVGYASGHPKLESGINWAIEASYKNAKTIA